jgi:hypothetical protein
MTQKMIKIGTMLHAIDGSIDHFSKKLEATKGPKVVKTFE